MSAQQTVFLMAMTLAFSLAAAGFAVLFFRRVRLPRPAIGVFNGRDVVIMLGFVVVLPYLYLGLPSWLVPVVLGLAFAGGLTIGYGTVVARARVRWLCILALLAADFTASRFAEDSWPAAGPYWVLNSALVLTLIVSAANLSAQGGLRLVHVSWFALALAVYDAFFATVVPLTQELADAMQGYAFAPSASIRIGDLGAFVGMGDLLVYALFTTVAYKAYGRTGLRTSLALVVLLGCVVTPLTPVVWEAFTGHLPSLVPAQIFFGPAAFVACRVLRAKAGEERRMVEVLPALSRPVTAS
ncbi:hypothetical protein AB0M28_02585 [Streptomyces sp. NPDC051940]|uniref:hypothetical protein n=1 Tax=Streptomyces sp. NPDC051940 TaxID=3155675 RepID=UPI0034189A0F